MSELGDRERAVLRQIAAADEPLYKRQAARLVELPYSTTVEIIDDLTDRGLLQSQSAERQQTNGNTALLTVYRVTDTGRHVLADG